jgi:hypothetical protein
MFLSNNLRFTVCDTLKLEQGAESESEENKLTKLREPTKLLGGRWGYKPSDWINSRLLLAKGGGYPYMERWGMRNR